MTNKEFFENVIKANLSTEITDKAKALLATVEKKSASKAKAQTENAKAKLQSKPIQINLEMEVRELQEFKRWPPSQCFLSQNILSYDN